MQEEGLFDEIFAVAKTMHEENKETYEKQIENKEKRALDELQSELAKRTNGVQRANPEKSNYSEELYDYIKEFGFVIDSYEQFEENLHTYDYFGDTPIEIYYCSYGVWQFKVKNYNDVDIEEGIFSLTDITHKETGVNVDFYCDLGCRNTAEARREALLDFLTYPSLEMFIQDQYGKYLRLPELLRKKGLDVTENDFSFELNEANGYLTLGDSLYVRVFRNRLDEMKVVVTNDETWSVNSSNYEGSADKAYYFEYDSVDDIDELVKCIDAFRLAQEGEIGYYEQATEQYYSNEDVYAFFDDFRSHENFYEEAWNHYHIKIEHAHSSDWHGDEELSRIVNKYKGLELFTETELTFNDAAQWSKGDIKNKSIITFEYDRRKSEQCRLLIKNYVYKDSLLMLDEETDEYIIDESHLTGMLEKHGSFLELMDIMKQYVHNMIEIHELTL